MVSCYAIAETLFSYETPKIVQIKSYIIGTVGRIIQLLILCYIIGYAIIYKKGYQEFSIAESSVTTKVKGIVYTNFSDEEFNGNVSNPAVYRRLWDVTDYVVPPSENDAVFIATNIIITENQTQGFCPESPDVSGAICDPENNDCRPGKDLPNGHGVTTGNCIKNGEIFTCEIAAWCPVESDVFPLKNNIPLLEASQNFTILIKNYVDFPKFPGSQRSNIRATSNQTYLKNCRYDPIFNQDCPVFTLGDIVQWCGQDFDALAYWGGIIAVDINWDCNLDFDKNDCFPTYHFNRLDNPNTQIAPGWNFRHADYYLTNARTLRKMYGIKLTINVVGQAGKFRIVPLLTNIGAGLGLLALNVIICDIVVLYMVKKREYFKSKKYEEVDSLVEP